jgi:hypothetical protein
MHYLERKPFIIYGLDDLDANGPTELISLLDQAEFSKDLLWTILGVIGRTMK